MAICRLQRKHDYSHSHSKTDNKAQETVGNLGTVQVCVNKCEMEEETNILFPVLKFKILSGLCSLNQYKHEGAFIPSI